MNPTVGSIVFGLTLPGFEPTTFKPKQVVAKGRNSHFVNGTTRLEDMVLFD